MTVIYILKKHPQNIFIYLLNRVLECHIYATKFQWITVASEIVEEKNSMIIGLNIC